MRGQRVRAVGLVLALAVAMSACGTEDDEGAAPSSPSSPSSPTSSSEPVAAPWPRTLTPYIDQSRAERVGREVFVRLVNEADDTVTVTRAEVTSDRYAPMTWTGEDTVENEDDLELRLPSGRCGTGSDAQVTLTYRLGDGPEQVSTTTATDRYGAVGLLLDRDCAEQTLARAATVEVGEPRVVGKGMRSRFELPLRLTATGRAPDVAFEGLEPTVLFVLTDASPVYLQERPVPMTAGTVVRTTLSVVPARCDPHALAEDKVGTLFGVHVSAPGLPDGAAYYLPLSDETRGELRAFIAPHCGWPTS